MDNPWLLAIRPKTLPASISPILLGNALALSQPNFNAWLFALALVCALCLQIAVNFANDLFDAQSGVDSAARLGPTRVIQAGLLAPQQLRRALYAAVLLACVCGLLLCAFSSWWLLGFGVLALLGVFLYSAGPWPLASHGLGELAVLLFFGWLAVMGSYFIQTLTLNAYVLGYATLAGLLSAAIMLVNNIRDISTDAAAGKNTLAVKIGQRAARRLYQAMLLSALLLHFVLSFALGWWSLLTAFAIAPLGCYLLGAIRYREAQQLNRQLAQTAQLLLLYCVIQSAVLWFLTGTGNLTLLTQ